MVKVDIKLKETRIKNKEILKSIDVLDKTYCKNLKTIAKLQAENVLAKSKQRRLRTNIITMRNIKIDRRLSTKEKLKIIKDRGNKCKECSATTRLTIHHKKSLSLGGTNRDNNLEVLCIDCHRKHHPINETAILNGEIPKVK